jgi:ribosomal protein L5
MSGNTLKMLKKTDPLTRLSFFHSRIVIPTLMQQLYDASPWKVAPPDSIVENRRKTTTQPLETDQVWTRSTPKISDVFTEETPELEKLIYPIALDVWRSPIDYDTRRRAFEWRLPPLAIHPYSPSPTRLPNIVGVTLSMTPFGAHNDKKAQTLSKHLLYVISGKMPSKLLADKSDALLKLRKGQLIGNKVDLDHAKMWTFLELFVETVLPRVREWNGFEEALDDVFEESDGQFRVTIPGTAVGLLPQIEPFFDRFPALYDMNITIKTTAKTKLELLTLVSSLGIPLTKIVEKEHVQSNINRILQVTEERAADSERFASFRAKKRDKNTRGSRKGVKKTVDAPFIMY